MAESEGASEGDGEVGESEGEEGESEGLGGRGGRTGACRCTWNEALATRIWATVDHPLLAIPTDRPWRDRTRLPRRQIPRVSPRGLLRPVDANLDFTSPPPRRYDTTTE